MVGSLHAGASVVVLAKDLGVAKTRLGLNREQAAQLALQLAVRTVRVAGDAELTGDVFVVTSDPRISYETARLGAIVVPEGRPRGMNHAAELGRAQALEERPEVPVAVMVADLPLLQSHELDAVIAGFPVGGGQLFVPDHRMTGTTFLMHSRERLPGVAFGPDSALMHRRLGYLPAMHAPLGLRIDLDVLEDAEALMRITKGTALAPEAALLEGLLRTSAGEDIGHPRIVVRDSCMTPQRHPPSPMRERRTIKQ